MDIDNRVVAITGAGSGVGRALALNFAQAGSHVAIADFNPDTLGSTAEALAKYQVKVTRHLIDVSKRVQVDKFAEQVSSQHGRVDIVVNNAGVVLLESVEDASYDDLRWIIDINLWGVIYGTKAFLPFLKQQPEARIVNITSIAGIAGTPMQTAYCATKFAVRGFTEALRYELANGPVGVCCVHLGTVKTNILRNARFYKNPNNSNKEPDQEKFVKHFEKTASNTPDKVATAVIQGVKNNKERIWIGWDARLVDYLSRFSPWLLRKIMEKI